MPSPFYTKLVDTVAVYTGKEKALGAIERQLKHCPNDAEKFGPADLKAILTYVTSATKLYVADAAKRDEMIGKITGLAA
ncbi:MAG TPA: hypothetical protein VFD92_04155 [Candidatus Binatia bacterium]|nr:hypothetical protein [Candidatus Binatia bacterium]